VVVAAGAWSKAIGEMVELEIPVEPRKGHLVVTVPLPDGIVNTKIILEAGYIDTLHAGPGLAVAANLQQTRTGSLVLGSSREFVGFDLDVTPGVIGAMLQRCLQFFPCLSKVHAIRSWAGLRPHSPDMLPLVGVVDDMQGLYVATGHEGRGITTGPITGELIGQLVTGQEPSLEISQLTPVRFRT
jgi:sarcosine oxidase subunit beta